MYFPNLDFPGEVVFVYQPEQCNEKESDPHFPHGSHTVWNLGDGEYGSNGVEKLSPVLFFGVS